MVDYIPFASYQIANGGVFKHVSENSESASKEEVDYLIDRHRSFAEFYTRRFIDFMIYNQSKYPEYNTNSEDDMYPDRDANFRWMGIMIRKSKPKKKEHREIKVIS